MNTIVYNDDNWLFPNQPLKTHDISYDDIQYLLNCADIDDHWAEDVKKMVQDRDEHPEKKGDFIIDEFRIMNASGTTILFPYGDRIITFCSKRQFFRGENQDFPYSIPSLRRKTMGMSKKQEELMRTVANMRIWQFTKLLWNNINVVPYWEAKLSDVNYKALAQHYGFDTNLLDLTNDFRIALFFATCKYIPEQDCFRPLTEQEINEKHKYGIIYHAPNWVLDFIAPGGSSEWYFQHMNDEDRWYGLDNGDLDSMAFQIGYQPLMRCHHQSGYVYPLRYGVSLNEDRRFERMRFKQSVELSQWVFKMMDGGKKVFPQEGITEIRDILIVKKSQKLFEDSLKSLRKNYISDFSDSIIYIINYVIDELTKNPLLLKFISKNLSWGVYNKAVLNIYDKTGNDTNNEPTLHDLFINGIKENNIKLSNPDVTLFMIIELVGSTCFNSILYKEPLPIEEYKPYLYKTIRNLIKSEE